MKRLTIIALAFFATEKIDAQRLFFNIAGGMINYGGDLQDKLFTFDQANKAFSFGASYKLSKYISVSGAFTAGKLAAADSKSNSDFVRRNLSFYSNLSEGSLTFEAALNDVPDVNRFTPYLFGGVAIFHFDPYAYTQNGDKVYLQPLSTEGQGLPEYPSRKVYKLTQFAIPYGAGVKYAISNSVIISAEVGFRKLFTDYLDDVSENYADTSVLRREKGDLSAKMSFRSDETSDPLQFSDKLKRGNSNRKDVYYLCLIKLSFSLGGGAGVSNSSYFKKMRKQTGCPQKNF